MTEPKETQSEHRLVTLMMKHQLTVLIVLTIVIALAFTSIGLWLYNKSGTAQIDLSRPGYEGIGKELADDSEYKNVDYSASGPITSETLHEFEELYEAQLENAMTIDAFSGDPLSPQSLGIDSPDDK